MKLVFFFFTGFFAAYASAQSQGEQYAGMDLSEGNALQMQICSLQPRKSMADRDRVMNAYLKWSKDNDAEVFLLRLTPMFGGADPNSGIDFTWIDILASSYSASGSAWDKWLNTDDGQKVNEQWVETTDCRVSINPAFNLFLDSEGLAGDTRIMTFNWCTRKEGVTWDQLNARHSELLAGRADDSPAKSWTIMYPGLGIRNPIGEFAHLVSFADVSGLMASQNALANQEGWRQRAAYYTSYADCTGENVYQAEVLNRP